MAVNSRTIQPGEFVIWESDHRYTRASGKLENDATIAGTSPDVYGSFIGQPLLLVGGVWRFATAAEVTTGTGTFGFVIDGPLVAQADALEGDDLTPSLYSILERGPAIINEGRIPTEDVYGDLIVAADYVAVANAMSIESKPLSTTVSTQTT